jgi:hypothetical protein
LGRSVRVGAETSKRSGLGRFAHLHSGALPAYTLAAPGHAVNPDSRFLKNSAAGRLLFAMTPHRADHLLADKGRCGGRESKRKAKQTNATQHTMKQQHACFPWPRVCCSSPRVGKWGRGVVEALNHDDKKACETATAQLVP